MRTRIRLLALAVVAIGGGTLASPRAAHATYAPLPTLGPLYCCCEVTPLNTCGNRCCSPRGCTVTTNGCQTTRV
jgi:hypothetical protein